MRFFVRKMSKRRSRTPRPPKTASTCCFCGFSEDDEVEYGKLYTHRGIVTHYYCLLLSSNMEQNGKDNQGILGFMPMDIQKELRRGKRLACVYCRKVGATLGCCNSRCKRVFHLPCGLQAGSLHQFFDEFRSYCVTHRIKQEIDEHIKEEAAAAGTVTCYICYEEVNPQNTIRTLWAPCCRKNAWFHRKCVQRLALSAGYFFKCPLCNNNQEFQKAMLEHGIFIPNQDASWELVPNAYQELLHRHSCCDAAECLCPKGRNYTGINAKWELVLCRLCGSQGVHKACGRLKWANSYWECDECLKMLHKTDAAVSLGETQMKKISPAPSDDDSSTGSDISVGQNPSPLTITENPESSPAVTSSMRIRPGPLSFKLQQAVKSIKSAESTNSAAPNTSQSSAILRHVLGTCGNDSKDAVSNESSSSEPLQAAVSPEKKNSPSIQSPEAQATSSVPRESSAPAEIDKGESAEPKRRSAEVIVIESDDEVEIISVKSKQNVLTTVDGTEIEIHTLSQAVTEQTEGEHVKVEHSQAQLLKLTSNQSQIIPPTRGSISPKTSSSILNSLSPTCTSPIMPPLHPLSVPTSPVTSKTGAYAGRKNLFGVEKSNSFADPVMNLKIVNITSVPIEDFDNTDSPVNSSPQRRIIRATDTTNALPGTRTTPFQLSSAAIKEINLKKRSKEYNCTVSNSPDAPVVEQIKRARISASSPVQNGTTYTWGINLNDGKGPIPMIAKSVTMTQPSNSNRSEQNPATMQIKPNESLISCNNGLRTVYSLEIQKRNDYHKYPPIPIAPKSGQSCVNSSGNRINVPSHKPLPIGTRENSLYFLENGHTLKQISATSIPASDINREQFVVSNLSNLSDQSRLSTQRGSAQPVFLNKSTTLTGGTVRVYQPSKDNTEVRGQSMESVKPVKTNLKEFGVYNERAKSSMKNSNSNSGNRPDGNNIFTTGQSMMELPKGLTIPSGCDGDAGSDPAAEAGATHRATISARQLHPTTESISDINAAKGPKQRVGAHSSISTPVSAIPAKYVQRYSSIKITGEHCDKSGLIPENVPLQDLKFRVIDSEIIEIIVCNNYKLNINANMGNLEKRCNTPNLQCSDRKKNLSPSSRRQNLRAESPKRSQNDSIGSRCKLDNKDVSNTPNHLANDKTRPSHLSKTKRSNGSEIFETTPGGCCIQGTPKTENVSKGESVSSTSSNNAQSPKPVYTREGRILSNEKCKYLSDDIIKFAVEKVQNSTAIDFCSKIHCSTVDKDEKKQASVADGSVDNLLDSSEINLSTGYSNYQETGRSIKLSANSKALDAGLGVLLMDDGTKDGNLRPKNGFSRVNNKAENSKHLGTLNLNDFPGQAIDKSSSLKSIDENGYSDESREGELGPTGIKVKINLNKIQHFIDSNKELFCKMRDTRNQCTGGSASAIPPLSSSPSSFSDNCSRKRSVFSNGSETSRSELKNTEIPNARKRFKYDPGLFRKDSKS